MICCSFIFEPLAYDEEFHRLDAEIAAYAKSLAGFVKVERWCSDDGLVRNSMYFFESMEPVLALAKFPAHSEAKSKVGKWYKHSRIDIFELTGRYGETDFGLKE